MNMKLVKDLNLGFGDAEIYKESKKIMNYSIKFLFTLIL